MTRELASQIAHEPPHNDAIVAWTLADFPTFEHWTHQPVPAELESKLLDLDEQELMTVAAVCLLRLAKNAESAEAA